MSLIKSISGIRGTIGGKTNENLTPIDIVKFVSAYATFIKSRHNEPNPTIIIGRDGRMSGEMVLNLVAYTLSGMGCHVKNLDYSTTPTVEYAVLHSEAKGGIIITASHNPKQWNALKLLNEHGEFLSGDEGKEIIAITEKEDWQFAEVDNLGKIEKVGDEFTRLHINAILNHSLVDKSIIQKANFKIAVDGINSTGSTFVPQLLQALGVEAIILINDEVHGDFAHNPEPLTEHLTQLRDTVLQHACHLGIAVDPDVDRLVFMNENGELFGEEYTLVAVADYYLSNKKGNTVSNMSSTLALKDVTEKHGGQYFSSEVGEVNVVRVMKDQHAVIGGEGNGGIIDPELHYGRDALVGIALFLTFLAKKEMKMSELKATYPLYFMSKNKIDIPDTKTWDEMLTFIKNEYADCEFDERDGIKLLRANEWLHLRKSNTEPIIRVYSESTTQDKADSWCEEIKNKLTLFLQ